MRLGSEPHGASLGIVMVAAPLDALDDNVIQPAEVEHMPRELGACPRQVHPIPGMGPERAPDPQLRPEDDRQEGPARQEGEDHAGPPASRATRKARSRPGSPSRPAKGARRVWP
jgi:hypothetical protein